MQDGQIFQAGGSGGPWVGQAVGSSQGVYLNQVETINTKIHSYRKANLLKNIDIEGDFDLDVIREKIIKKKYQQSTANKFNQLSTAGNFSNLYLTENSSGDVKMLFSFNWKAMLLSKTLFPRIFENTADYVLAEIINKSKIISVKMIRKKIPLSAASSLHLVNNQSAAPLGTDNKTNVHTQDHDLYENEDVFLDVQGVVNPGASITYKRLYPESSELNGTFTELNYGTPAGNTSGIRTFSLTDLNVKRYSEGKYQYGIEMEFLDGSIDWLREKKNNLLNPLRLLREYYLSSTIAKFYMEDAGKFTDYFISFSESRGATDTILNCIQAYCEVLEALFNKSVDEEIINVLYSIAAPATGTPEGILTFLNLLESIHSKLDEVLDKISAKPPIPGETDSAVEGSSKTTFGSVGNTQKIVHYFSDLYEKERYLGGYNFIFPNHTSGVNAKGSEDFSKGLTVIPFSTYKKRITQEMEKYYTTGVSSNETLSWSSFNLGFTGDADENTNIDFSNRKYSFLTPGTVNLAGEETNCLHISRKVKGMSELSSGEKSAFAKIISDIMKFNLQKKVSLSHVSNLGTFHDNLQDTEKQSLELRQELRNVLNSMSVTVVNSKDNFSLLNTEDDEKEKQLKNIATDEQSKSLEDPGNQQLADIPENLNINDLLMKTALSRLWMIGGIGWSDYFTAGFVLDTKVDAIEDYDPKNWDFMGYDGSQHILKNMPPQLISLSLAVPELWAKGGHAWLRRKWNAETTQMTLENFNFEFFAYFFLNYKKIVQVEYVHSYKANSDGETLLKSPVWKILDAQAITNIQTNNIGSSVLCRIRDWNAYSNSPFKKKHSNLSDKQLDLKTFNEYFIIKF